MRTFDEFFLPEGWERMDRSDLPEMFRDMETEGELVTGVRSLQDLIRKATGQGEEGAALEDAGLAEVHPFPFLALVGMERVQQALILAVINPRVGGVLLLGPTGVGKTTAVRSLAGVLPQVPRSLCYYGCLPEDIEEGGPEAVCPKCAEKYRRGEPLAVMEPARLLELPYPIQPEEVWGTLDERAARKGRHRLRRGLLGLADRQVLFVDEITRYPAAVQEAVIEAGSQGHYTLSRGGLTAMYRSQFLLVATLNPQRGRLPFPMLDRFGMRVVVQPVTAAEERALLWERVQAWRRSPRAFVQAYEESTQALRRDIQEARDRLARVRVPEATLQATARLMARLGLPSLRADLALLEAARAYAAAEGRETVTPEDVRAVAPFVLPLRHPEEAEAYFTTGQAPEAPWAQRVEEILHNGGAP